jgi:RNA recognition motif-containing protein
MKAHNRATPQYASHWYEGTDGGTRPPAASSNQHNNARGAPVSAPRDRAKEADAWPENDFRIFVGNLGSEVNDVLLNSTFAAKYSSVAMSKVMRDKKSGKSKGFGFVSFLDFKECADALRTMAGNYIGTRPIMLKVSTNNKNSRSRKKGKRGSYRGGKGRGGGRRHHR